MIKKHICLYAAILILASIILPLAVSASNITDASYIGTIQGTNNGTAASNVAGNFTLGTAGLIAAGQLNATATNVVARDDNGNDIAFMPGFMGAWIIMFPSISAGASRNAYIYTGNVTGGKLVYFTGSTGMSVSDTMTEPGGNFTATLIDTWIDTTAGMNKVIVRKPNAYEVIVSDTVSGNISARITGTSYTANVTPNAAGNYTALSPQPAVANYLNVDDPPAAPDDAATYNYQNVNVNTKDAYNLSTVTWSTYGLIEIKSVKVYFRCNASGGSNGVAIPYLRLNNVETTGTQVTVNTVGWTTYSENLTRPGGGSWTTADIDALQVGIGLRTPNATGLTHVTQVYVAVTFNKIYQVTSPDVTSGEQDLPYGLNSPFWWISSTSSGLPPVTQNLTLNLPLWQTECSTSPFTTIDSTGYTATVNGAVTWTSLGRDFPGSGNITLPAGASWNFAGDFSIEVIFNLNNINRNIIKSVSSNDWNTAAANDWLIDVGGDSIARFYIKGGATVATTSTISTGTWYNLLFTRVGNNLKAYLNGVDVTAGAPSHAGAIGNTKSLVLGQAQTNLDAAMDGRIAETRIYNGYGLSGTQPLQNFNAVKVKYGYTGTTYVYSTTATVPDTTSPTQWGSANTTLYIGSMSYTKGGTLIDTWQWENAATYTGNITGNIGTPSWRTTSSDSDVTTTLILFEPINQAVPDQEMIDDWPDMITAVPTQPATMYTDNSTPGIFFAPLIAAIWPDDIPVSYFWYNFTFFTILAASIGVFYFFAAHGKDALLLKIIVSTTIMIFWALPGPNVYGFFVVIYHCFWCFGIIVLSRSYGWS